MRGQLDFDGYEIQADTIKIPGVGTIPLGKIKPDLDVHIGDAFTLTIRCYIDNVRFGAPGDGRGNLKEEFGRAFVGSVDHQEWALVSYVTKAERDAAFLRDHGAA